MATYSYLAPAAAAIMVERPGSLGSGIRGLRVAEAEWCTRTKGGNPRVPDQGWVGPQRHRDKFKVLDRMELLTKNCNPGTYELFFEDGTSTYLHADELLCVERPIMPVHYGETTSACDELPKYHTLATHRDAVTCKDCVRAVKASV